MTPAERLAELVDGRNPQIIRRMRSGFAILHETQFLPGYCLLLGYPQASHLNELHRKLRNQFFDDMGILGDAVMLATECVRINYSVYGNLDPFLHAHIVPRYDWEPDELKTLPPLSYPLEIRSSDIHTWELEAHAELQDRIARCLQTTLESHGMASHGDWS